MSNDHTAGGNVDGEELTDLIKRAVELGDTQTLDEHNEFCALVDRFADRVMKAMSEETPPFMITESEKQAYMDRLRHKILHSMFDLGRVYEQKMGGEVGSAFKDFLNTGLDFGDTDES